MKHNIFQAFSEKPFLFLWLSEIFTQISVNLFNFYLILTVYTLTHSNTAVAGVIISFTIPAILFGIVAGVYVDRRDKKRVLGICNILRAFLLLFLAFFHTNLLIIYLVSFCISIVTQFFIPAETPMIPLLVKQEVLFSANALFSMAIFGSILLAYVLSGPLILLFGQIGTLIILAVALLIGAVFISFIKLPKTQKKPDSIDFMANLDIGREIKRALELMSRTREIYGSLFLLALAQILILVIAAVIPGFANQVLGMKVEEFPVIFVTPAALGMILGGIFLVNVFHHYSRNKMVIVGLFLSGVSMMVLPFASAISSHDFVKVVNSLIPHFLTITNIHILIFLAFVLGVANALVFVPSNTILQEQTADEFRGKIYGGLNSIVGIFSLVPIIAVGGLSDLIGVGRVIIGIGISLVMLGIVRVVMR